MKKTLVLFFLVLLLATFLRFWKLGEVPSGITNDEANYIYSAYSIWNTQHDINGEYLPLSFNLDNSLSPVPVYLLAPIVGILGMNPFTGRLLFAFAGVLCVLLIYLITKKIFNNFTIAIISMFVMAVSPWHLQFSRSAYEGTLALFFYLLATYIFLITLKSGKIFLSIPFFFLGFFSYHATKIFFIFYIFLLLFVYKKEIIKYKSSLLLFIFGIIFIFASFIFISKTQNVTRSYVLLFNDSQAAARLVDEERAVNSAPLFMRNIFNNKALYFLRAVRENYLEAFSPQFLFLYGETSGLSGIYGTSFRGVLYTAELVLLILGLVFVFSQKNSKARNFIVISLLIAPLPSSFTIDRSYALRSIMMLPFLVILIGCGLYYLFNLRKTNKTILFASFLIMFSFVYLFQILGYIYQYQFRYSIYGAESWFRSTRDIVEFIGKEKGNYNNVYIVNNGDFLVQYAFFNKTKPSLVQAAYKSKVPKKIENVNFISGCIDTKGILFEPSKFLPKKTLYVVPAGCHIGQKPEKTIKQVGQPLRKIWDIYKNN